MKNLSHSSFFDNLDQNNEKASSSKETEENFNLKSNEILKSEKQLEETRLKYFHKMVKTLKNIVKGLSFL